MEVSKKEKLLALGSALYLLGLEVESSRERMEARFQEGYSLCSPEVLEAYGAFSHLSVKFTRLEEQFLRLKGEIQSAEG